MILTGSGRLSPILVFSKRFLTVLVKSMLFSAILGTSGRFLVVVGVFLVVGGGCRQLSAVLNGS